MEYPFDNITVHGCSFIGITQLYYNTGTCFEVNDHVEGMLAIWLVMAEGLSATCVGVEKAHPQTQA